MPTTRNFRFEFMYYLRQSRNTIEEPFNLRSHVSISRQTVFLMILDKRDLFQRFLILKKCDWNFWQCFDYPKNQNRHITKIYIKMRAIYSMNKLITVLLQSVLVIIFSLDLLKASQTLQQSCKATVTSFWRKRKFRVWPSPGHFRWTPIVFCSGNFHLSGSWAGWTNH